MVDVSDSAPPRAPDARASVERMMRGAQDFSLVLGGPLFQLLRRSRFTDDALRLVHRRVLLGLLLTWVPLAALCAMEGNLAGDRVAVTFLLDVEVHVRFMLAMPLLIVAELVVHQRMRPIAQAFVERNLVPEAAMARFDDAIASAFRLRNSVLAELLLIGVVYGVGVLVIWRQYTALDAATWYATPGADGSKLSLAGTWYGYVSVPVFQFLLVRWYYRLFIWTRFLLQVSRIDLALVPTHPDRVGGLGFLSMTVHALAALAVAHGAMLAGWLAARIFFLGASLADFKVEIALMAGLMLCVTFGPLLAFSNQLARVKRDGLREYGALAQRYVRDFDAKWLRGGASPDEALVGSGDIQSLADLANSYDVVRSMRLAPLTRDALVQLAAAVLLPIAPLALTMMPLEELLQRLFGLLF